jgi:hypothetical protein
MLGSGSYASNSTYLDSVDLPDPACYDLNMFDSWGDGWNGAYVEIIDPASGVVMYTLGTGFTSGNAYTESFCLPWIPGCTDPGASNYDPLANADDGSCTYGCIASDTLESFEYSGAFGTTWANLPTNTVDWTVWSNGTSSSSTGPSSAYNGTYYIYTETSGAGSNSDARIQVQCVDLSTWTLPGLTFQYHMYGATMGTLEVNISTDAGLTWTNAWSLSGDQGDQWSLGMVDLTPYGTIFPFLKAKLISCCCSLREGNYPTIFKSEINAFNIIFINRMGCRCCSRYNSKIWNSSWIWWATCRLFCNI